MTYKKNLWFTLIAVLPVLALNVSAGNIVLNENTVGAKAMPAVIEDIAGTPFILYPSPPYKEHTCSTYFYTNLQYGIP